MKIEENRLINHFSLKSASFKCEFPLVLPATCIATYTWASWLVTLREGGEQLANFPTIGLN